MNITEKKIKETEARTYAYLSSVVIGFLSANMLMLSCSFIYSLLEYLIPYISQQRGKLRRKMALCRFKWTLFMRLSDNSFSISSVFRYAALDTKNKMHWKKTSGYNYFKRFNNHFTSRLGLSVNLDIGNINLS